MTPGESHSEWYQYHCSNFYVFRSDFAFIMLINVKMPTIFGILIFMRRMNSCSAELSMEKFYNLVARFRIWTLAHGQHTQSTGNFPATARSAVVYNATDT